MKRIFLTIAFLLAMCAAGFSQNTGSAAWTSATAQNTAVTLNVTGYNSVTVYLTQGTTITGGAVTFEVAGQPGFTLPFAVSCVALQLPVYGSTYTLVANANQAFRCDVGGQNGFRVRLGTVITGTGTVNVSVQASTAVVPGMIVTIPPANSTGPAFNTVQNVVRDTANTTVAQLASSATFTGAYTSTLGVATYQVTALADQQLTVNVDQSKSGSGTADITKTYIVPACTAPCVAPVNALTFTMTEEFVRLRVTNNGGSTTTTLSVLAELCPSCAPGGVTGFDPVTGAMYVSQEGQKTTYRAGSTWSPAAASATDIFTITGSATKTVRVTHLGISCTATAAIASDVIFLTRSTADTAGTSSAVTRVPIDPNDVAATATVLTYTANPTTGNLVGNVSIDKASITATTGAPQFYFEDFSIRNGRALVLRGTGSVLAVNLNSASIAGIACSAELEWTEE